MDAPDALLRAIIRAGRANPTPAGVASALRAARSLCERRLLAERQTLFSHHREAGALQPPLPEPDGPGPIVLRLAVAEHWCASCGAPVTLGIELTDAGEDIAYRRRYNTCCAHPQLVPVSDILPPENYYVAN
jgi:hypothetical protein